MAKAHRAATSARTLAASGDAEGAINRAYYAMSDAARALLHHVDPISPAAKTHSTVLRRFGHVALTSGLDRHLGRALSRAEKSRLAADYDEDNADLSEAHNVIELMEQMLAAIDALLSGPAP
jgi:uncharacterized protein (UPF0332 family)